MVEFLTLGGIEANWVSVLWEVPAMADLWHTQLLAIIWESSCPFQEMSDMDGRSDATFLGLAFLLV